MDKEGVIAIGHTRLKAAQKLGLTHVPVHVAENLTPGQIKALRLADNRTNQESSWDDALLGPEITDLKDLNIDLSLTAFDPREIDGKLYGVTPEWAGMPEFKQEDQMAWQTVYVHFSGTSGRDEFGKIVGQTLTDTTKSIWFPKAEKENRMNMRYESATGGNPKYPVYVISKSRWESRLTSNALEAIKVPYHIVVEPQERADYAAVIDPAKILVLPFSNLGQGSIPARNWVWEDAASKGHERHWILDDNIRTFYRLHENTKVRVSDGVMFRAAEDYIDRFTNVALAGFNYQWLAKQKQKLPPFVANTRIYSCILIKNDLPYRWRGRYNEDTDLSLRALKEGYCTVLFNAFLADKQCTMTMKGGNTDELYRDDGRLKMAQSLQEQHPDVVTVTRKWNRWQHQVDYRPFKNNKFIPKPGFTVPNDTNNYGMELVDVSKAA